MWNLKKRLLGMIIMVFSAVTSVLILTGCEEEGYARHTSQEISAQCVKDPVTPGGRGNFRICRESNSLVGYWKKFNIRK